jgi:hypothetical protein
MTLLQKQTAHDPQGMTLALNTIRAVLGTLRGRKAEHSENHDHNSLHC